MTIVLTGSALTTEAQSRTRVALKKLFEERKVSADTLAGWLGLSESRVIAWWSNAHPPLYLLAHPRVPLSVVVSIVGALLLQREDRGRVTRSIEAATAQVAQLAAEALSQLVSVLADGRVDPSEREVVRKLVAKLRDVCDQWLREHSEPAETRGLS